VLITHRVAAAARCDRVVVLDGGRVVERGPTPSSSRAAGSTRASPSGRRLEAELEAL
jgi:ATP-binding cassette subfamily B multidrug efflux pump